MNDKGDLERRRCSRVATVPASMPEGIRVGHPLIVDVSQGGACLWLSNPPPRGRDLALRLRYAGHDRVLLSRIVWSRLCATSPDRDGPALGDGWLAGLAFAKGDERTLVADVPHELLRTGHIAVSVLAENDSAGRWPKKKEREEANSGVIAFSEQSMRSVKAAADELLPVLGKHFSDVHLVIRRDRLEISAPFRPLAELNPTETRRRDYGATHASQVVSPPVPVRIQQPAAVIEAARIDHPADPIQPRRAQLIKHPRRGAIVAAGIAAVILTWSFPGFWHKSVANPAQSRFSLEGRSVPAWAPGLDESSMVGWISIQKKFALPEATVRSAIQILRSNDKFSPGHSLYDLSSYPTEVSRAFSLLAQAQAGAPFDFGPLEKDLKGRMVEGVRFPDEAPGGRYSSLEREGFNNVLVLATIELFHRHQDDPRVKETLAALRKDRS